METKITDAPEIEEGIALAEAYSATSLWTAMLGAQREAPALQRDGTNPHFRSDYVTLEALLNAALPVLNRQGLVLVQATDAINGDDVLVTKLVHAETGEFTEAVTRLKAGKDDAQAYGSALTYARRYALMSMLGLTGEDDDDGNAAVARVESMGQAEKHQREEEKRAPRKPREFDPAKDLLPGAITVRTEEDATMLRQAQRDLDPNQNWVEIEDDLCELVFGRRYSKDWNTKEKREFWTRFANAVVRVQDIAGPGGDFPPPTLEQIAEGYAFAFDGHAPALVKATGSDLPPSEDSPEAGATPDETKPEEAADGEAEAQPDAT